MNRNLSKYVCLSLSAFAAGFAFVPAVKADDKADEGGKIVLSGLADVYYQYGFNHTQAGVPTAGRAFDVKSNEFGLSLLEVNVKKTTGTKNNVGFTAQFTVGKTADLVNATEPAGVNTYKYIQQLYGTYVANGANPVTFDFGKFTTHMGYEVIESSNNDNYSRSFLFNYAIPLYHSGVRATKTLTSGLTGQVSFTNGWNNVEDNNGGKTIGAQLAYAPTAKYNLTLNYIGGDESTGAGLFQASSMDALAMNLNVQVGELVATYNLSDKVKVGANAVYASANKAGVGGTWSGQALYGRTQLKANTALAVRLEHFEDTNGLRTGVVQNLNEVTATYEYNLAANMVSRLEFRHDHSGVGFFPTKNGVSKNQDTLTYSQVFKF